MEDKEMGDLIRDIHVGESYRKDKLVSDDGENIPNSNYGRNLVNLGSIEVKAQGPKVDPDDGQIEENQSNCVEILESNLSTWTVKSGTMEEEEGESKMEVVEEMSQAQH
ncbi:hypothetical protein RYX36_003166 [Vicia faba]